MTDEELFDFLKSALNTSTRSARRPQPTAALRGTRTNSL